MIAPESINIQKVFSVRNTTLGLQSCCYPDTAQLSVFLSALTEQARSVSQCTIHLNVTVRNSRRTTVSRRCEAPRPSRSRLIAEQRSPGQLWAKLASLTPCSVSTLFDNPRDNSHRRMPKGKATGQTRLPYTRFGDVWHRKLPAAPWH